MTTNTVEQRLAVLAADVATLKQNSITRTDIQQLLSALGRMDANMAQLNQRVGHIDTNVTQLNNRVERLEEIVAVVPELSQKVDAIGNDIQWLVQKIWT